jgi:hypothetical protein
MSNPASLRAQWSLRLKLRLKEIASEIVSKIAS